MQDEVLTVEEVAEILKLKPPTVSRMAKRGEIPGEKFGNKWRFSRRAIEEKLRPETKVAVR